MVLADFPPASYLKVASPSHDRRGAVENLVPAGAAGDVELSLALRACPELPLRGQRNPNE